MAEFFLNEPRQKNYISVETIDFFYLRTSNFTQRSNVLMDVMILNWFLLERIIRAFILKVLNSIFFILKF